MWSDQGRCVRFVELSTNEKLQNPDTLLMIRKYAMRIVDPNPSKESPVIYRTTLKRVQKLKETFPELREFDFAERLLCGKLGLSLN